MTVRQRVLAARIAERIEKNPKIAKEMGISVEYPKNFDSLIENEDPKLIHKNDQLLK